jgi:hypothetical protein
MNDPHPQMTADDLVRRMGSKLIRDDFGRFPELEQDAMRYWVLLELVSNFDPKAAAVIEESLDKKIEQITQR